MAKLAFNKRFHNAAVNFAQSEKALSDMSIEAVLNYFEKQYQAQYIGNVLYSIHNVDGFREEVRKKIVKFLNDFAGFETKKDDNGNFVFVEGRAEVKKNDKKLVKALQRANIFDMDESEITDAITAYRAANPSMDNQPDSYIRGVVVAADRAEKMKEAITKYLSTLSGGTIFGKKLKDEAKEDVLTLVPSKHVKLAKLREKAGEKAHKEIVKNKLTRNETAIHYAEMIKYGFPTLEDFIQAYNEATTGALSPVSEVTEQAE